MTVILADARLGVMVSDSKWSDGVQKGSVRKVWRIRGALLGFAGLIEESTQYIAWYRAGCVDKPPKMGHLSVLLLSADGLFHSANSEILMPVSAGFHAIGTGGVPAMCAHDALGRKSPREAVKFVCKHDAGCDGPVRTYRL